MTYRMWLSQDPKRGQRWYVINIETKQVQSSWTDFMEAKRVWKDLNTWARIEAEKKKSKFPRVMTNAELAEEQAKQKEENGNETA